MYIDEMITKIHIKLYRRDSALRRIEDAEERLCLSSKEHKEEQRLLIRATKRELAFITNYCKSFLRLLQSKKDHSVRSINYWPDDVLNLRSRGIPADRMEKTLWKHLERIDEIGWNLPPHLPAERRNIFVRLKEYKMMKLEEQLSANSRLKAGERVRVREECGGYSAYITGGGGIWGEFRTRSLTALIELTTTGK